MIELKDEESGVSQSELSIVKTTLGEDNQKNPLHARVTVYDVTKKD